MSATIPLVKPPTPAERIKSALERVQAILPEARNAKLLEAILLETAARSLALGDTSLMEQISAKYNVDSAPKPKAPASKRPSTNRPRATPKVSDFVEPLVPINHIPNYEVSLAGPPDPDILLKVFGAHQLAKALNQRSPSDVRKAAALVQERHPGTKPQPKASKASLIAYIVEQVAGDSTH